MLVTVVKVGFAVGSIRHRGRPTPLLKPSDDAMDVANCHTAVRDTRFCEFGRPVSALSGGVTNEPGLTIWASTEHALVANSQPTTAVRPIVVGVGFPLVAPGAASHITSLARDTMVIVGLLHEVIPPLGSTTSEFK